jgi:hypothetical protein
MVNKSHQRPTNLFLGRCTLVTYPAVTLAHFWISRLEKEVYAVGLPQKWIGSLTEVSGEGAPRPVAQLCPPIGTLRFYIFPRTKNQC